MVRRGGREITPVDIWKENYEYLRNQAQQKRFPAVQYINNLLMMNIEKEKMLALYAPNLSVEDIESDHVTLKNSKDRNFIDVYVRNSQLQCTLDKSTDCVHVHYVWAMPELAKLHIKRPPSAPRH